MSKLLPSASFDWLPIVALLCLASILFLAFSARKYFASRAQDEAMQDAAPIERRIELSTPPASPSAHDYSGESTISRLALSTGAAPLLPLASTNEGPDDHSIEDQRPLASDEPNASVIEPQATNLGETVRARVARDRASAQGLIDLVRALYLDESNFTFHMIAQLQPDDRALARALIEQWLADPMAIEYWEQMYAGLREIPDALHSPPSSSFAGFAPRA